MSPPDRVFNFTCRYNKTAKLLVTEVIVSMAHNPLKATSSQKYGKYWGIWDTGATHCVITRKVINQCGLQPIGMTEVHTAGGSKRSKTYLINIGLPNRVLISEVRVTEGEIRDSDVLIGMDVINRGDLALTNKDGKTTLSFRIPSIECIDFVGQKPPILRPFPKVGRNDPCPCGSGKKYKKCCGK